MARRIGIIGSGIVGQTLATGFLKHGYHVTVGSGTPGKLAQWLEKNPLGKTGSFEEAIDFAQILVLAIKGLAAEGFIKKYASKLTGKTIVDTTNPIADEAPEKGVLKYFTSLENSLMERLQILAPGANFIKAFNSVGSDFMVDPKFESKPTMFICGNNPEAKEQVKNLLTELGWDFADMGNAESARAIEPLCMLWCIPGLRENKWKHAFKLLSVN
jgi:8-hydroxy-5-deazaflavin:NADPH oxidoreductase